ncbi:filamin-A-like [Gigantopelta aegis]|uniref:filamin-A-like n=1 Tax=Gigantopelta aegis TaxID=1735272 RepID=UPI001B88B803|nr:filamin-A-like [Gigantopelta aegis]
MTQEKKRDNVLPHERMGNVSRGGTEDQWVALQHKTFVNWVNEQLTMSGRSVENLATDFCDGVKLVALVESLQFRKIGKVYMKPKSKIQMLQNVDLAFRAIVDDNIRLVNIGNEDVVNGNLKLVLGLLWHLILRYQISSSKSKAPPKKLMLAWFQSVLPDMEISNFTEAWSTGIALHALIDYCKPGTSPNWRKLDPRNRIDNCRQAMQLAKTHLNIPIVITPEDFASKSLDQLSAMTYLSYFIKKDSPGYYATLNWVCRLLRTTTISNLSTDWNDGVFLCSVVNALGGEVPGWPDIDKNDHVGTCQKGIDGGKTLGVEPTLTAQDMADPEVDHLAIMAYLSKFRKITPKKSKAEKLVIKCTLNRVREGNQTTFSLDIVDADVMKSKTEVKLQGPNSPVPCDVKWGEKRATCSFVPNQTGQYTLHVKYDGEELVGSPVTFMVIPDVSKVKLLSLASAKFATGQKVDIKVDVSGVSMGETKMEVTPPSGQVRLLQCERDHDLIRASFHPDLEGNWTVSVWFEGEEIEGSPITVTCFDPNLMSLTGPRQIVLGDDVTFTVSGVDNGSHDISVIVNYRDGSRVDNVDVRQSSDVMEASFTPAKSGKYTVHVKLKDTNIKGSPLCLDVLDPGQIVVSGDGVTHGTKGEETEFVVDTKGLAGTIDVVIDVSSTPVTYNKTMLSEGRYSYRYIPSLAGKYTISVKWNGRHVTGSPFSPGITDRSGVNITSDLSDLKDEIDRLVLECEEVTTLTFDVSDAGPGQFTAEVLSPNGKIPVDVDQSRDVTNVSFTAKEEGDHYIHLYWCDLALEFSPIVAFCAGPKLPIDASKVVVVGKGAEQARTMVSTEFMIDGRKAGPGVCRVRIQGVRSNIPVDMRAMKYNRYVCTYVPPSAGGFLLYVHWSDVMVPWCPYKISVRSRGEIGLVKVTGEDLNGGITGQELKVYVDASAAGSGELTATCVGHSQGARCEVKENNTGHYVIKIYPTEPEKHLLQIRFDDQHVPGSPFVLRIGEPPNPNEVKVFGPGVEDGLLQTFESRFLVETHGAGAGQLAVKVRGPRGGFKVDMKREGNGDRTIVCRYDPVESGEYTVHVRWSGVHVPGSPFVVNIFDTREEFHAYLRELGRPTVRESQWHADI